MLEFDSHEDTAAATVRRIEVLNRLLWKGLGDAPSVDRWVQNFDGRANDSSLTLQRLNALHLLSHFSYFGTVEVRELLRSMYRDLFRAPLIREIRRRDQLSRDPVELRVAYERELEATRFIGVGSPSESGNHLLYFLRQENEELETRHMPNLIDVYSGSPEDGMKLPGGVRRFVFIDDMVGTGDQALKYGAPLLAHLRSAAASDGVTVEVIYLAMFARPGGLQSVREIGFDRVDTVFELNESEVAFHPESHVYSDPPDGVSRIVGEEVAWFHGSEISPGNGYGYGEGQLLLGLQHNVPDHTLPIFWEDEGVVPWEPIFKRYRKH